MKKNFFDGILAGILISIGGVVYLSSKDNVVGAILFSVALLCICFKEYALFTGKVGYIVENCSKSNVVNLMLCLAGNLTATYICGLIFRYITPELGNTANIICLNKLLQLPIQTIVKGIFCGILMYLAVSTYKEKNTLLGILFCVPVFILSGFEHSIANSFYFGASGIYSFEVAIYFILVILANSLGGMLFPLISKISNLQRNNKKEM